MKPSEVLREARNVLFERGWHQGDFTPLDADDEPVADGPVCAYGAIGVVLGDVCCEGIDTTAVDPFLFAALGVGRDAEIPEWNDEPGRTFGEVIDVFDKAEKLAEAAEVAS